MKPLMEVELRGVRVVAPHAGAWIETSLTPVNPSVVPVAPHAGAWIETFVATAGSRMPLVAPHAGAWIETYYRQWPQAG